MPCQNIDLSGFFEQNSIRLEETLCFGWIGGQMQSIDNTKYHKYFAKRRQKSAWSDKNKKTVEVLREKGIMTELGEKASETAKKNGTWDALKGRPITEEDIGAFTEKLVGLSPAYENSLECRRLSVTHTRDDTFLSRRKKRGRGIFKRLLIA